ncbi:MAG: hypothetical protein A2103_03610 [Gammaproteobacteria bacterium GWF2_41_13]|nr:MAG: hypothetical protein A2103_03610 [Gammaproteobacteria bacterium GWF2_41_13]
MKKELFLKKLSAVCGVSMHGLDGTEFLQQSGFFDSLALLGLIAMCDKEFHITIPTREILQLSTVNDLYIKIQEKVNAKA